MFKNKKVYLLLLVLIIAMMFINIANMNKTALVSTTVSTSPSIRLPIIMYHHVLKDSKSLGKYTISPKEFEGDIIYLKKQGYTTIDVEDLIAYEYNNVSLPEKPIMLTFDDGYLSNYTYIVPILEKYKCKAVISIVGKYVDNSTKDPYPNPYLNWTQVKELVDSPYVEIQNHTYSMHEISERRGCSIIKGESFDEYKTEIVDDVGYLQVLMEEKTGYKPKAFTYPYGFTCKECNVILEEIGFLSTFTCNTGVNFLSGNKDELYELKRFNRPSGINRAKFFNQFEK